MTASTEDVALPQPEDGDPSDVTVALEAARALWDNGETREALRWYARAAEAAEESGDDMRALTLARSLAEIRDAIGSHSLVPPAPRTSAPPDPPQASAQPEAPAPPTAEPAPSPPTEPQAPTSDQQPARSSRAEPPTPSVHAAPSTPASSAKPAVADSPATTARPKASRVPEERPAGASKPEPAPVAPPSAAPKARSAPAATGSVRPAASRSTAVAPSQSGLRVAVKASVRDPNLLIVRVIGQSVPLPAGTREAFLSPAVPGEDLLSPDL